MASEKRATLVLELKDLATKGLKSFVDVLALGKLAVAGFNATFGKLTDFLVSSLESFAQSEVAVNRLNKSLQNQGFYTDAYSKSLQNQAAQLQAVTTFSDEAVIETQTLLTSFGLAGEKLRDTTKAALDLSKGLGVDLRTATLILGKAWAGETGTLSKYGIKISETGSQAEKFAQALSQVQSRFGGAAESAVNTYAGRIENLKNNFDDLKEKIGKELVPVAEFWVKKLADWTAAANKAVEGDDTLTKSKDKVIVSVRIRIEQLKEELQLANRSLEEQQKLRAELDRTVQSYVNLTNAQKAKPKAAEVPEPVSKSPVDDELTKALEDERIKLESKAAMEITSYQLTKDQIKAMEVERMARELEQIDQHGQAKALREAYYANVIKTQGMQALNNLASLRNSKNKEMAAVGKAAAISQATIQTYLGATAAYTALAPIPIVGPALGVAAAAAAIVAGMANVAAINGTPLAEGGMLMARSGGVPAIMAEAGRAEVAIPLDDERTTEKLQNTLGRGGGNTVNVNVGTLVATRESMKELAVVIDEELFRLEKNRRSVRG